MIGLNLRLLHVNTWLFLSAARLQSITVLGLLVLAIFVSVFRYLANMFMTQTLAYVINNKITVHRHNNKPTDQYY